MTIEQLSSLLCNYIPSHLILDQNKDFAAVSPAFEKRLRFNEISRETLIDHIKSQKLDGMEHSQIITNLQGKKFFVRYSPVTMNDRDYTIVALQSFSASRDPNLRLHCLEEVLKNINDGVIVSDAEGKIIVYNPAQEQLEELASNEVVGKYLWEAYNYHSIELSEHRKVFETGVPIINNYSAHSHRDGIPKYLSYSTFPIYMEEDIVAVYSISKNETTLANLLTETIDLKRKLRDHSVNALSDRENGTRFSFSDIIGDSERTSRVISEAQGMALIDSALLIVGKTGTGKEVFAQSIHNFGKKKKEPFVAINCGAIPENLLESILFGTVKGSYTGATDQVGLFEEAGSGTLFLDELNSMPIAMQSKLLRVLQERKVRPVGSQKTIPIHCRIISAVNENPETLISEGKLRQDLFYRIARLYLHIPPLSERLDDIPSLCGHFISKCNSMLDRYIEGISSELEDVFRRHPWPGNIRELEHLVENLMIRTQAHETELRIEHIPPYMRASLLASPSGESSQNTSGSLTAVLQDIERRLILDQLAKNGWNISQTSRDLGIVRQSLIYRMKKLSIEKPM